MNNKTFMPIDANTASIVAGVASATIALDPFSNVVRVVNDGTLTTFINFGGATVAATISRMPIRPGATETFTKGASTHVAAMTGVAGTSTLYFTNGEGL